MIFKDACTRPEDAWDSQRQSVTEYSLCARSCTTCASRGYGGEMVSGEGDDEIWQQNNAVAAPNAVINLFKPLYRTF